MNHKVGCFAQHDDDEALCDCFTPVVLWGVFLSWVGDSYGIPYDLQFIGSTKTSATRFAAELRDVLNPVWIDLIENFWGYFDENHRFWVLRLSPITVDVARGYQPSDPKELREAVHKYLNGTSTGSDNPSGNGVGGERPVNILG